MMTKSAEKSLSVTLLGTGTPSPGMNRFGPSILVEAGGEKFVFDAGRGAMQRLFQLGLPFAENLFLTHLHSDHVVGLPDLWLTGWILGRATPFRVWGPIGTKKMMSHLEKAFEFDLRIRTYYPREGASVLAEDFTEGVVYEKDGVKVTAFEVDHGCVKPAFGCRVDFAGHSVVLSGDTSFSENLIRHAQGADVLILNLVVPEAFRAHATFHTPEQIEEIIPLHTTPEQAGEIFNRVKPKLALYSHISPPVAKAEEIIPVTRKTYSGPLKIGEDLMTIDVGEIVEVRRLDA
jgi:ribonuclease Z